MSNQNEKMYFFFEKELLEIRTALLLCRMALAGSSNFVLFDMCDRIIGAINNAVEKEREKHE